VKYALLAALLAACGTPEPVGPTDKPASTDADLTIRSNVREADVNIDGRVVGRLNKGAIRLALEPGKHQVSISRDDYFTAYLDLSVARAEKRVVKLDLAPVLP
jgi:hypothetical protein